MDDEDDEEYEMTLCDVGVTTASVGSENKVGVTNSVAVAVGGAAATSAEIVAAAAVYALDSKACSVGVASAPQALSTMDKIRMMKLDLVFMVSPMGMIHVVAIIPRH